MSTDINIKELLQEAIDAFNARRLDEAALKATSVLLIEPDDQRPRWEHASACWIMSTIHLAFSEMNHLSINQKIPALHWLRKALVLSPDNYDLCMEYGELLHKMWRVSDSSRWFRWSTFMRPGDGKSQEKHRQSLTDEWLMASFGKRVGREPSKTYADKVQSGFFSTYCSGANILDVGNGFYPPIVDHAIAVDLGYPGYDGIHLPFADNSQDTVYSSHCLEHVEYPVATIREWFRVTKIGGYIVMSVPHQFLYEKRNSLPSKWNKSHLRFFTPAKLMDVVEEALQPNHYRIRRLTDNDFSYDYSLPPTTHAAGCYEIELVLEKIQPPAWELQID